MDTFCHVSEDTVAEAGSQLVSLPVTEEAECRNLGAFPELSYLFSLGSLTIEWSSHPNLPNIENASDMPEIVFHDDSV